MLCVLSVDTLDEAIELINNNPYGFCHFHIRPYSLFIFCKPIVQEMEQLFSQQMVQPQGSSRQTLMSDRSDSCPCCTTLDCYPILDYPDRLGWMFPFRSLCQWCRSLDPGEASLVILTSMGSRCFVLWSRRCRMQFSIFFSSLSYSLVCMLRVCPQGLNFYTQVKTVTSMWREGDAGGKSALSMPVLWNIFSV